MRFWHRPNRSCTVKSGAGAFCTAASSEAGAVWQGTDAIVPNSSNYPTGFSGGIDLFLVPVAGLDLRFYPGMGENRGSHQGLHWWQQVSAGHLHLDGFEPVISNA